LALLKVLTRWLYIRYYIGITSLQKGWHIMNINRKELFNMKIFPKGQVVIPVHLRKKYHIEIGDYVEAISETDGILLKPLQHGKNKKIFLTDELCGIFKKYSAQKDIPGKDKITKAMEDSFVEGWEE